MQVSLFILVPLFLLSIQGQSQSVLNTLNSPNADGGGAFGWDVAPAGDDFDLDGYPDVLISATQELSAGLGSGNVYLMNPIDGSVILTMYSPNPSTFRFGSSIAPLNGDADSDLLFDFIIGDSQTDSLATVDGLVHIHSGLDGSLIRTLVSPNPENYGQFGTDVASANGDLNSDGVFDVIVGAPSENGGLSGTGRVYVLSGADGSVIHTINSPNPTANGEFGYAVSSTGEDVNSDGIVDIIVGAYAEDAVESSAGRAYVFSGSTGDLLHTLESPGEVEDGRFGLSVAHISDVNSDGFPDVIVGAENESGSMTNDGQVHVFSGNTGSLLYTLTSPDPNNGGSFGISVSSTYGDLNSDGISDFIVGAYDEVGLSEGQAHIYSGADGGLITSIQSPDPIAYGQFGISVTGIGDVSSDGVTDVLVGAWLEGESITTTEGQAHVFANLGTTTLDNQSQEELSIDIFPNPATDHVTVVFPAIGNYLLNLMTLDGKKILEVEVTHQRIANLTQLALSPGMYMLRVRYDDGELTRKLVIE